MKTKEEHYVIDPIGLSMVKPKLNYRDQSDRLQSVMKTNHDNDVINHTCAFYVEKVLNFHDRSYQVQSVIKTKWDNDATDWLGTYFDLNQIG